MTNQRSISLLEFPEDVKPRNISIDNKELKVECKSENVVSKVTSI